MIKLIKLCGNNYRVQCEDYKIFVEGDELSAQAALWYCGVDDDEINFAFEQLLHNNHDIAEFGINKLFMYTTLRNPLLGHAS